MENLSSTETSLLLAIQSKPRQRLAMYSNSLKDTAYIQVLHARNRLIQLNMIVESDTGLIEVNESAMNKINAEIMQEHGEEVTVHTFADPDIQAKPLGTATVQKFEDVDVKVLEHLRNSPMGRTAAELASPFGSKGTSLNWTLRNLIKSQRVVKRDLKYFLAEECDKVTQVEVVQDTRRVVDTELEIRTFVLQQEGEFTLEQCYAQMSKIYIIDKEKFAGVFTDLVLDGYFNVYDGIGYVQHDMEFCADNLHERCVNVSSEDGISDLLKDFIATVKNPFTLEAVVKSTGLRHDRIVPKLAGWGYNVNDPTRIVKHSVPTVEGYADFEHIDIAAAQLLIFGIVKIDVFMKRFNLDPRTKGTVIANLLMLNMATYDTDSGFLGPFKKPKAVVVEDVEENEEPETLVGKVLELAKDAGTTEEFFEHAPEDTEEYGTETNDSVAAPKPISIYLGRDYARAHVSKEAHSVYYGHTVLSVDAFGIAVISTEPDHEWIKTQDVQTEEVRNYGNEHAFNVHVNPAEPIPTHITEPSSLIYGHTVLGSSVINGQRLLAVSSNPDFAWLSANPKPDTVIPNILKMLERENIVEMLEEKFPERAVQFLDTNTEDDEKDISEYLEILDAKTALKTPTDSVTAKTGTFGFPVEKHESACDDQAHKLGQCGPSGIEGSYGTAKVKVKVPETVNPVDPRWIVTLQMMEERFYHEHQTTTAKILSEIREFLSQ